MKENFVEVVEITHKLVTLKNNLLGAILFYEAANTGDVRDLSSNVGLLQYINVTLLHHTSFPYFFRVFVMSSYHRRCASEFETSEIKGRTASFPRLMFHVMCDLQKSFDRALFSKARTRSNKNPENPTCNHQNQEFQRK